MKNLVLLTVLAAVAVYVNAAVVDLVEVGESVSVFPSEVEDEPELVNAPRVVHESGAEHPGIIFKFGTDEDGELNGEISTRKRLIFSKTYRKEAIDNAVRTQTITIRFKASTRITDIQVAEIGNTQYATAHIIDGGVHRNFVVIRLTSARGRGYNFGVHIYGRSNRL